jgi:hypothetical protein
MAEEILRYAQDFACGLPLGFASLTPAKRLNLDDVGIDAVNRRAESFEKHSG